MEEGSELSLQIEALPLRTHRPSDSLRSLLLLYLPLQSQTPDSCRIALVCGESQVMFLIENKFLLEKKGVL